MSLPRILLHVCCGPCATAALERLREEGEVTLFFANSNLWPESEFQRRLAAARRLADASGCALVVDPYDHEAWRRFVQGFEQEPERGARCRRCFEFSLRRAAAYAREAGFELLTSTLSISPHKRSADIFRAGERAFGGFLAIDFKKRDGFRRSLELSRALELYRQDYCGCEFSLRPRDRA
ncbi:MAG: epoxyqueuosine reductase QueH [Lentisphaeria bacterium]|nr:epoxyqueuosine reductase QueH [Lentisphaeria bacterium]